MSDKKTKNKLQHFDWPLTGKLITAYDPLLIGESNYKTLTNLRYTDKNIRGIQGMTALNSSAFGYTKVQTGFHFRKEQPAYDAVFCQTTSGNNSAILKSSTTSNVPNADTFSSFQTLATNTPGNFVQAPNGSMVFCNGDTNYIYGGSESPVGLFVVEDPAGSFRYDYTNNVTNTLRDANDVANMTSVAAAVDAYTSMLLHLDNNVTDSSSNAVTVTNNNVTFSNSIYKFGGYSGQFNGTSAYLSTPEATQFNFNGGTFTIDAWVYPTSFSAINSIYYQQTTSVANNIQLYLDTSGYLNFVITASSSATLTLTSPVAVTLNAWNYVQVTESGNNWYLFINGVLVLQTSDSHRAAAYTGNIQVGYNGTNYFVGYMDEVRVSTIARNTSTFTPSLQAYGATSTCYAAVLYTRALQGIKFYVGTANTNAATVQVYTWNGSALTACANVSDGTAVGGKTLAQTGEIIFTSTVGTAQIRYAENTLAYFYYVVFSGLSAGTTVYSCTVDAPIQPLTDIWDGSQRPPAACYIYTSSYSDVITNVSAQDYSSINNITYAEVGGLTSSQYLYFGCADRLTAIGFLLPDSSYINTNGSVMTVSYWNGSAWVSVGQLSDGTATQGKSFNKTGVVSWAAPAISSEFTTTVATSDPWYYYRVQFSNTLSADVRLDYIWGVPCPLPIRPSGFPLVWQERLWLLNDVTNHKNQAWSSAVDTNCVFNGTDSYQISFGSDDAIVGAATLYSRFGSSLYDNMIVVKRNSTYLVDFVFTGAATSTTPAPGEYKVYNISQTVGCVAPYTLQACDMSFVIGQGAQKHVILWQSDSGIEMFDGNSLTTVSDDIADFFDSTQSNYVNTAMVSSFYAFYDDVKAEYHWLCATGGSTTLNREMVYDMHRKKWFEIDRTAGKKLACGFLAQDTLGNKYLYGGTYDGHLELLANGTTMDGQPIAYTFEFGDIPLSKSLMYYSMVRNIKLVAIGKNITTATITCTLYMDTNTTGVILPVMTMASPGSRLIGLLDLSTTNMSLGAQTANTHRFKFTVSTNNEVVGFEPLMVSGFSEVVREDVT